MPLKYKVEFDDVEGHRLRMALDPEPQAVTVRAADGEDYPATLTIADVEGHVGYLDFGSAGVEGYRVKWNLDQGPHALRIQAADGEEMTGTLIAEGDDVEGHRVRKPTDFPNSTIP